MKIIGLTGNSGSGKSTVCKILEKKYNTKIIDADKIARELTMQKSNYLKDIVEKFGKEILDEMGCLNRCKLAEIIYNSKEKREELNKITFIYVVNEIKQEINKMDDKAVVVIDAPLLFESGLNEICDVTVGVIASYNVKIDRICNRDWINNETATKRLNTQLKDKYLVKNVDYILQNNSTIEELEKEIERIKKQIIL